MNIRKLSALTAFAFLAFAQSMAQPFNSGSTGELGDMNIDKPTILDIPPDGVFHVKSFTLGRDGVLTFRPNALNTPVYILSQGDILLSGTINISGSRGSGTAGGIAGPGGFDGGRPGFGDTEPGSGYGPGGGLGGIRDNTEGGAGPGGFHDAAVGNSSGRGQPYGNSLLIPLIGGSGGGGVAYYGDWGTGYGGGGGGGALLLASNTRVIFAPVDGGSGVNILAIGGEGSPVNNGGSGGAIRIVAPVVAGSCNMSVEGRNWSSAGRVRIDAIDVSGLNRNVNPNYTLSIGSVLVARLDPEPRLEIVEAAGTKIPENTIAPVQISLPSGSSPNRTVVLQAKNFGTKVPVEVVLAPDGGLPVIAKAIVDNSTENPARISVDVIFPVNVGVTVQAWVRGKP